MAGNGDEGGADWLWSVFERLRVTILAAADLLAKVEIHDMAGALKAAQTAGAIARAARAIDLLRQHAEAAEAADGEEDERGGRTYDPDEDERIRQKLLVESARIEGIFERKRAEAADRRAAAAAGALASGAGPPVPV